MIRSHRAGLALICGILATGCGGKTSLPAPSDDGGDDGQRREERPGRDDDDDDDDGEGDGDEIRPDPPCTLEPAGEPFVAADFAEGNANAPFVVATQSGENGPAQIVLQALSQDANFWHPELRLSRWAIGQDWPAGATLEQGFTLAGTDAHAWGRIGFLPGSRVGLAWFRGDEAAGLPTGLKFRPIEPDGWSFGEEVFVDPTGETAYSITPFDGRPDTEWAITYRGALEDFTIETRMALVSARGEPVVPPIVLAGAREYPGISADVVSTGDSWLAVVPFDTCVAGDTACDGAALVVMTVNPQGSPQIVARASFPVETAGNVPRRASLARDGDQIWIAWTETLPFDDAAPRRIVLAAVDGQGEVVVAPHTIGDGVVTTVGVQLSTGPDGPVVVWGEPGDPGVLPEQIGAAAYVVHHERASGPAEQARFATTAFAYSPGSPAAELFDPRGIVVSWAANIPGQQRTGVWLARLDCR